MLHAIGLHALGLQTVVDTLQAILQESDYIALTALRSGHVAPCNCYMPDYKQTGPVTQPVTFPAGCQSGT